MKTTTAAPPPTKMTATTTALLLLVVTLPTAVAFLSSSSSSSSALSAGPKCIAFTSYRPTTTSLGYSDGPAGTAGRGPPLPSTNDPFVLLGLESHEGQPRSTVDEKAVKRAYRKMTRLHHPDAVTTKDSTDEERKRANDDFARINSAYAAIMNRNEEVEVKSTTVESPFQRPWYESPQETFSEFVSGSVSDIFERNAQKKKNARKNGGYAYGNHNPRTTTVGAGTGASARRSAGAGTGRTAGAGKPAGKPPPRAAAASSTPRASAAGPTSTNTGGFKSSDSNPRDDIFARNKQKRERDRHNGTGAYDPNRESLEQRLSYLQKNAEFEKAEYEALKSEMKTANRFLERQNKALTKDAANARARCKSLEEELKKSKSEARASTLSSRDKQSLEKKIVALRKDANEAKARCNALKKELATSKSTLKKEKKALEEKVAVAKVRCESLEAALQQSKAQAENVISSSNNKGNREMEALRKRIAELEASESVAKKQCASLEKERNRRHNDISDLKQALATSRDECKRLKVSESVARSGGRFNQTPSLKIPSMLNNMSRKQHTPPPDDSRPSPAVATSSRSRIPTGVRAKVPKQYAPPDPRPSPTVASSSRIPTGARAKMPIQHDTSKKVDGFSSAIGLATGSSTEGSEAKEDETDVSAPASRRSQLFRRAGKVSKQMHEKKSLVIVSSLALLMLRSLLRAWIKVGMI